MKETTSWKLWNKPEIKARVQEAFDRFVERNPGAQRVPWFQIFKANPELKADLAIETDQDAANFRTWTYNVLDRSKFNGGHKVKAMAHPRRAGRRAVVKRIREILARDPQLPSPEYIQPAATVEAPISFCPVCGSDLRECRAKARS